VKTLYVLWGQKEDDPSWSEDVIIETINFEKLEQAKKQAKNNGYKKFRISEFKGESPDFIGTINI